MLFFLFNKIYMYLCYLCMSKNIIKHILLNIDTTRKILKSKIFYSKGTYYFRQLSF